MKQISETTAQRLRTALWVLLGVEFFTTMVVLGTAGSTPAAFEALPVTGAPGKVIYNIVVAVFTFLALLVIIPLKYISPHWWKTSFIKNRAPWPAVAANAVATIFWIGALGSAFYTCSDLCGIAPEADYFHWSTVCCECPAANEITCPSSGGSGPSENDLGDEYIGPRYQATQAFDALGMLFFMASTAIILILHFMGPKKSSAAQPLNEYDNPYNAWDPVENPSNYKYPVAEQHFSGEEIRPSMDGYGYDYQPPNPAYHGHYQHPAELDSYARQNRGYNGP